MLDIFIELSAFKTILSGLKCKDYACADKDFQLRMGVTFHRENADALMLEWCEKLSNMKSLKSLKNLV